MQIEKLLKEPVSTTLEFKRDLSSSHPIIKTIIAFANTAGGTLIIGKAEDGTILGVEDIFKAEEKIANLVAENIAPTLLPEIEIATIQGKNLLIVKVSYWKAPFYLKKLGQPDSNPESVYFRLGSTNRPANPALIAEMRRSVLSTFWDEEPIAELSIKSLDLAGARKRFKGVSKNLTEEKLRSIGALVKMPNKLVPSIGSLILFGKEEERLRLLIGGFVRCARFLGTTKSTFLDRYDVKGSALDAVDEVLNFIARNTRLASEIRSIKRKDIPEYPEIAIREALINALAHTDYSIAGTFIEIAIFSDRLEINNPGMLPFGYTIEDFKTGVSRIRNRVIARVFSLLNLMESWGSGYKRIIETCENEGYPRPKWEELGASIRVTFYPHEKSLLKQKDKEPFSDIEKEILFMLKKRDSIAFREIKEKLKNPLSDRSLRYILNALKEKGALFSTGKGRAIVWHKNKIEII